MTKEICKKVSSMLSLYIDNKLSEDQMEFVEKHLAECNECCKKYVYLKSLIKNLKDSYKQVVYLAKKKKQNAGFNIKEHERFLNNLSPYVDNELDVYECYEFRKYLMKSKNAQKILKNTYILQKELRKSFDRTGKSLDFDNTKYITRILKSGNKFNQNYQKNILKFNPKIAKIAILSGLVIFSSVQLKSYYAMKEFSKQKQEFNIISKILNPNAILKKFVDINR